jgi:sporulation protein YlmC with PRC-barrel domain
MSDGTPRNDLDGAISYVYRQENLPAIADVEDLRWKNLVGSDGEKIGQIENIEVDEQSDRVEFLEVRHGGFLGFHAERFLVPVTAITQVDDKNVCIDRTLEQLNGVPPYEFERVDDPDYYLGIRSWWGGSGE